eukprot:c7967_g1_i2.p1 GENE.c7967_g1_i2~~c7967_g1_i2.p1  ORF type:complete len:229 (+),score=42.89 c7967_g1_i2:451-1137(+)
MLTRAACTCTTVPLAGTVKAFRWHLFVGLGSSDPLQWPPRAEESSERWQQLSQALKDLGPEVANQVAITGCAPDSNHIFPDDVLMFPGSRMFRGSQTISNIVSQIQQTATQTFSTLPTPVPPQNSRTWAFVCCHGSRDSRCGTCGVRVLNRLANAVRERNLTDLVSVHPCSHVGGHKYAANVLFYPSGDWFGLVDEQNVDALVDSYLVKGQLLKDQWRGKLGQSSSSS